MNNVKTNFSIKDLENLSGIKAHTIRVWEKRYNILEPGRTATNIRSYDVAGLQKLLNVKLLHNFGYKISMISKLDDLKIAELVNETVSKQNAGEHAISTFIAAMMNFDESLFFATWRRLLSQKSFGEVFYDVIIPLLGQIGILWQTNTITPAHEHFISYLVRQKILANIQNEQREAVRRDKIFILFLPSDEMHEIGLMYLHYQIISAGFKAIFLGSCTPLESLADFSKHFDNCVFVSYFTVAPHADEVNGYLESFSRKILNDNCELWIAGRNVSAINQTLLPSNITVFGSLENVVEKLRQ